MINEKEQDIRQVQSALRLLSSKKGGIIADVIRKHNHIHSAFDMAAKQVIFDLENKNIEL